MASISAKAFKLAAMVSSVGVYHALSSGCRPLLDSKQSLDTSKLDPEPDELWATPPPSLRESAEDMLKQFSQSAVEFCGFVDRSPSGQNQLL